MFKISLRGLLLLLCVIAIQQTYARKGQNYTSPSLHKKTTTESPNVTIPDLQVDWYEDELVHIASHPNWKLLDNEVCGENLKTRIIGGHAAELGEHPWIARLGRYITRLGIEQEVEWFCGGSLLNKNFIITAAHCTTEDNFRLVRFGEFDLNSPIDCNSAGICAPPPQDRVPLHIMNHKGYKTDLSSPAHDIALVLLSQPIEYNDYIMPICLPMGSFTELNTGTAEVIGWGLFIPETPSVPALLRSVSVDILPEEECKSSYYPYLDKGTLCAGTKKDEDSCNGDSGGPLLKVSDMTGISRYYLIGLVSFGPLQCGNGAAGGYTNITYHLPWILKRIGSFNAINLRTPNISV